MGVRAGVKKTVPGYYELSVCAVFPFKGIVLYFANEQYVGEGNEPQELICKQLDMKNLN